MFKHLRFVVIFLVLTELRTLMSGQIADEVFRADLESAHDDGETLVAKIFENRLFSTKTSVYTTHCTDKTGSRLLILLRMKAKLIRTSSSDYTAPLVGVNRSFLFC